MDRVFVVVEIVTSAGKKGGTISGWVTERLLDYVEGKSTFPDVIVLYRFAVGDQKDYVAGERVISVKRELTY